MVTIIVRILLAIISTAQQQQLNLSTDAYTASLEINKQTKAMKWISDSDIHIQIRSSAQQMTQMQIMNVNVMAKYIMVPNTAMTLQEAH